MEFGPELIANEQSPFNLEGFDASSFEGSGSGASHVVAPEEAQAGVRAEPPTAPINAGD